MENYIGKTLNGRYDVREVVGVGGMAIVYKAFDSLENRIVAIKILKEEFLANEEFRRRFKNESNAIAILSHPNIVKVLDFYFSDRLQYIVMEFIEGITLKEYIEQQRVVSWKESLHFITQILRALQHAHDKGVVHRDIKPQNIMVLQNGSIKVTDFGIARFSRGETRTLAETGAIGSVHYISPEQARGETTDNKTDIYSIGVVLYEMLTGQLPFQSDSAVSVALMQVQAEARKPRDINPNIPVGLEQITMRAMQKKKYDRYQSAAEMLLDLDEFKRNPLIKFDYSYYQEPRQVNYVPPVPAENVSRAGFDDFDDDEFQESETVQKTQRTIALPVIATILVIFVLGLIGAGVYLYKNVFNKDRITVPNFTNKDYDYVIENYGNDFTFENPPKYVYDSSYEDGMVCEQDPAAGESVLIGTVIRLTVAASSSEKIEIPLNILTYKGEEAASLLEELGLTPHIIPAAEYDATKTDGIVINTVPAPGQKVDYGALVAVYINQKQTENIKVPDLIGEKLEIAIEKLELSNLEVGEKKEVPSAAAQKGYIIDQSPKGATEVETGTKVDLFYGSGIPENKTVNYEIKLPQHSGVTKNIKVLLNDTVISASDVLLDGSTFTATFTGSEKDNTFVIKIDNFEYIKGTIDFTAERNQCKVTEKNDYVATVPIPDVRTYSLNSAKKKLSDAGFTSTPKIEYRETDEYEPGIVISQTPAAGSSKEYPYSQQITLIVSKEPSVIPTSDPPNEGEN